MSAAVAGEENGSYYERNLGALHLVWPETAEGPALRAAQLGAVLSLAGHLQTSDEAAQAVLPTGVGKTVVMCGLPYLIPTRRVLVVVPTRLLRDQIAEEFAELTTLLHAGALSEGVDHPAVHRVEHQLATEDDWRALEAYDVVVGTPGVLSASHEGVAPPPQGLFDLLIFDEAHHLPATTWTGLYEQHRQRAALLTATPFRRDRKRLPGRLVYHYSLRQAISDGVYSPVTFVPVDVAVDVDRPVAEAAIARLRSEPHQQEGSLLLVRTERVEHAKQLVTLYGELGITIGLITAQQSGRHVRRTIGRLHAGELLGVASVGALVEGFDLPKLKVAAYHRPHKSLPATLQFIGRIARVTGGAAPAELVAARNAVTSETAELYREDVAWIELLPQLADATVLEERETRQYLAEAEVKGPEELSPSALAPRRMVQVFDSSNCPDIDLAKDFSYLPHGRVVFRFIDSDGALLAVVTERRSRPVWIESDVLDTFEYHLLLVVHDENRHLLFVTAPSITSGAQLREKIGAEEAKQISPQLVARYLWAGHVISYSSVGMSSTRAAARLASYRMLAGSSVEEAVSRAEVRGYGLGHVIGRRGVGNDLTGMGISVKKSKIWESASSESLLDFRNWCYELADAISAPAEQTESVPYLQLRLPEQLERFPHHPLAAFLDPALLRGDNRAVVGETLVDLASLQTVVERLDDEHLLLRIGSEDDDLWRGYLALDGTVEPQGDDLTIVRPDTNRESLADVLYDTPPKIYYANGSSSAGSILFEPLKELPAPPDTAFDLWDWATTDIRRETGNPGDGRVSIQDRVLEYVAASLNAEIVFVDHGSYEIADVVAIEIEQDTCRVHLFHCKASSEAAAGARLDDLYEVLSQGVRSARWSAPTALWAELARRVRDRPGLTVIGRERNDVAAELQVWADDPPAVDLRVWVVQPGISQAATAGWPEGQTLITNAYEWCLDMPARLVLAVSP